MERIEKNEQIVNQTEDSREFAEMLKSLTESEKAQVKGIMIGLKMARDAHGALASA